MIVVLLSQLSYGEGQSADYLEDQIYTDVSGLTKIELSHTPTWEVEGRVKWQYLRPLALDYDNTAGCDSGANCVDIIEYEVLEIGSSNDTGHTLGNKTVKDYVSGEGTYLFRSSDKKGVVLHRVAVRRGDDYIGHVTELIGVPFVYYPSDEHDLGHQTDRGLGADCVATLIYGKRRIGNVIPYVAPKRLYDYASKIGDSTVLDITKIEVADILHFGFQTAVVSKDAPPVGVLSDNDKVIHSYHEYVEEVEFGSLRYREMPFDILRWNI